MDSQGREDCKVELVHLLMKDFHFLALMLRFPAFFINDDILGRQSLSGGTRSPTSLDRVNTE
jgi:hypothetical protein